MGTKEYTTNAYKDGQIVRQAVIDHILTHFLLLHILHTLYILFFTHLYLFYMHLHTLHILFHSIHTYLATFFLRNFIYSYTCYSLYIICTYLLHFFFHILCTPLL